MIRENRYLVLKLSDIDKYLNQEDRATLSRICRDIRISRSTANRVADITCVVVEEDWPMYEDTWKAIEEWVDSQGQV